MSKRAKATMAVILAAFGGLAAVAVARSGPGPNRTAAAKPLRLADATMIVELNSTDGDAGLQAFLDGEPWTSMTVSDPDGRRLIDIDASGKLNRFGLTELFSETNEPEFSELPLRKFKQRFPEGRYRFSGETIEGRKLVGKAKLSHDIPEGPKITEPAAGSTVPAGSVVARWDPVPETGGIDIIGYRVIVEREDPLRVFNADLPASATSVTIPSEFLEPGTRYLLEIQSIEASGNQTISEHHFRVG